MVDRCVCVCTYACLTVFLVNRDLSDDPTKTGLLRSLNNSERVTPEIC